MKDNSIRPIQRQVLSSISYRLNIQVGSFCAVFLCIYYIFSFMMYNVLYDYLHCFSDNKVDDDDKYDPIK